jgi:hypothetical protein
MEAGALAHWTPVDLAIDGAEPTVDWCDLAGIGFTEPFFSQTLKRAAALDPPPALVRTTLSGLAQIEEAAPGRDPDGFVLHLARCGSTLVSRLAAQVPDVAVLSEPEPLNTLLELDPARVDEAVRVECVRLLLRAYARSRPASRHVLVKLSSWNIRRIHLLRQAFPSVPWAFVYREPAEVVSSLLAGPPGWMQLRQAPERAESLLGIPRDGVPALDDAGFAVAAVAGFIEAALAADQDSPALLVDYPSLPDAVWQRILPFFGIPCPVDRAAQLAEAARWDAKHPDRPFQADGRAKRAALAPAVADLVDRVLQPLFRQLEARRVERATAPAGTP